jgi:hypothetical protein
MNKLIWFIRSKVLLEFPTWDEAVVLRSLITLRRDLEVEFIYGSRADNDPPTAISPRTQTSQIRWKILEAR